MTTRKWKQQSRTRSKSINAEQCRKSPSDPLPFRRQPQAPSAVRSTQARSLRARTRDKRRRIRETTISQLPPSSPLLLHAHRSAPLSSIRTRRCSLRPNSGRLRRFPKFNLSPIRWARRRPLYRWTAQRTTPSSRTAREREQNHVRPLPLFIPFAQSTLQCWARLNAPQTSHSRHSHRQSSSNQRRQLIHSTPRLTYNNLLPVFLLRTTSTTPPFRSPRAKSNDI